jgi:hypothetical protein
MSNRAQRKMNCFVGRGGRRFTAAVVFCWLASGVAAFGQETQPVPSGDIPAPPEARRHGREKRGERPERDHEGRMGKLPGAYLLRTLPEDQGPLTEKEQEELLDFVRQHAPEMYEALQATKQGKPEDFQEQFQRAAPQLRRLQRIYQRNPELGESIIKHTRNLRKFRQIRHAWRDTAQDPAARQRIEEVMRQIVAENVEIETAVLEDQIRELEFQREARVKAEFNRLTAEDTDLTAEPPQVRAWAEQLRGRPPRAEAEWLEDELWLVCAQRMDVEAGMARKFLERMRGDVQAEVDRRMERLTRDRAESRPTAPDHD